MLSADCECAACAGAFSPRGRHPRASADKAIDSAARRRLREDHRFSEQLAGSSGSPATPRLPAIGTIPDSGGRLLQQQTSPASEPRRAPRRSARAKESRLRLELGEDVDELSPRPPPPGSGSSSAKTQDLSSKLQDLYEGSHASYSPRTMAIYSDRQQALRSDPSGVAKDEAKLVAQLARGRNRETVSQMVSMPGQRGVTLNRTIAPALGGADGGASPRRNGTQANMLAMAEGYSTVSPPSRHHAFHFWSYR